MKAVERRGHPRGDAIRDDAMSLKVIRRLEQPPFVEPGAA